MRISENSDEEVPAVVERQESFEGRYQRRVSFCEELDDWCHIRHSVDELHWVGECFPPETCSLFNDFSKLSLPFSIHIERESVKSFELSSDRFDLLQIE